MWVVNILKSFVVNVGSKVIFQTNIDFGMLIFAPIMTVVTTSISIILIKFIRNKVFYFTPCATKLLTIKYILKGSLNYLLDYSKSFPRC